MLDFARTWLPFFYLYGLGGFLFVLGIIITIKAGSFDLKRFNHKKWLWILIFGFVWYITMHMLLMLAALDLISVFSVPITLLLLVMIFIIVTFKLKTKIGA